MLGLRQYTLVIIALLLSAGAIAQSADDSLTLVSGEILRGDLLDIDDGVVSFRTRHGSRTYLPFDQLQSMSTAQPRLVTLKGGQTTTGRLAVTDGKLTVNSVDMIPIADVVRLALVAESTDAATETDVAVETGVLLREGNRSHVDLYARIELGRSAEGYNWNWRTLFALDRTDDFPNYLNSEFEWRGIPGASRRTFALVGFERDRDAALDARPYAAAGVDYAWRDNSQHHLRGGIGLGVAYESFERHGHSTNDTDLDILLRVIYNSQLRDRLTFRNELRGMPSLTDFGEFRASYDSGLAWSLLDGLELNLQLRIDYDDNPPFAGLDDWRAAVGAGLRVRFGPR